MNNLCILRMESMREWKKNSVNLLTHQINKKYSFGPSIFYLKKSFENRVQWISRPKSISGRNRSRKCTKTIKTEWIHLYVVKLRKNKLIFQLPRLSFTNKATENQDNPNMPREFDYFLSNIPTQKNLYFLEDFVSESLKSIEH